MVGTVIKEEEDYSARIWFITDAEEYGGFTATLFNVNAMASATILAPVPEPTSITLLLVGAFAGVGSTSSAEGDSLTQRWGVLQSAFQGGRPLPRAACHYGLRANRA